MKRFDEQFAALDGPAPAALHRGDAISKANGPSSTRKAILPFSLFDSDLLFGRCGSRQAQGSRAARPRPATEVRPRHRRRGPPHPQPRDLPAPGGAVLLRQRPGGAVPDRDAGPAGQRRPLHAAERAAARPRHRPGELRADGRAEPVHQRGGAALPRRAAGLAAGGARAARRRWRRPSGAGCSSASRRRSRPSTTGSGSDGLEDARPRGADARDRGRSTPSVR